MNLYGEVGSIYHEWQFLIMSYFEDGFAGEENSALGTAEFFRINQHRPGIERDSGVVRQYDFAGFAVARRDLAQFRACFGNRLTICDFVVDFQCRPRNEYQHCGSGCACQCNFAYLLPDSSAHDFRLGFFSPVCRGHHFRECLVQFIFR